jgi:hypothetical protein
MEISMTSKFLKYGALFLALSLSFAAQAENGYFNDLRTCQPGTHSETFPGGAGYRCVPDR